MTTAADYTALMLLVDVAHRRLGRKPRAVSADSSFATEADLAAMANRRIAAYLLISLMEADSGTSQPGILVGRSEILGRHTGGRLHDSW